MNETELKQKLETWTADVTIPPRFQADVWLKIASHQAARKNAFGQWFAIEFARPRIAMAAAAASILISLGIAHIEARDANERQWKQLQVRYVQSVNPLEQPR